MKGITVRAVLQSHKKNKDNRSPVAICITINRKRTYKVTGFHAHAGEWDLGKCLFKNAAQNSGLMNAKINRLVSDWEAEFLKQDLQGKKPSLRSVKRGSDHTFNSFALEHIKFLEGKRFAVGTIFNYHNEIGKLFEYDQGVTFEDMDQGYLKKYETFLREKGLSENSLHKNWKILKAIFNAAIKEGVTTAYPFYAYKNPKYRNPEKAYLTQIEVDKIEAALQKPVSDYMYRTGYFFLLSCYCGLRYSDLVRFNPAFISEGRLILRAKKNGETISMKIHARLQRIIDVCLKLDPELDNPNMNSYLKGLAELSGIDKDITVHSGRKTFACLCAEYGISEESCAEFMGISVRVVKVYYKVTGTKLDTEILKWDSPPSKPR